MLLFSALPRFRKKISNRRLENWGAMAQVIGITAMANQISAHPSKINRSWVNQSSDRPL
jgi:hypothetical protein